ncbi:MAG: site-specific integrase [Bacteroidales bacterium]|nr:site-specific integrase [Bacteroidales bacterium]
MTTTIKKDCRRKRKTLFRYMEDIILRYKQLNRAGTARTHRATLESFRKFKKGRDVRFEEIDHFLLEDYEAYLYARGLTPNTTSFYMRVLRAVYNRAVEDEITRDKKPFRTVFTGMEKTQKRAISTWEVKRIRNLLLPEQPSLAFARDIFLFLFYCRGMSFVDAAHLLKTDMQDGILLYRRRKTNQLIRIKVERQMLEIINRYNRSYSPYLLPIISSKPKDEVREYSNAIHRINRQLKEIGRMADLHIPLSTYVSRHTWATMAKRKNIPMRVISESLGHESEMTTQIYLDSIGQSRIDKANNLIISGL